MSLFLFYFFFNLTFLEARFIRFLGDLKIPKGHFEIILPLVFKTYNSWLLWQTVIFVQRKRSDGRLVFVSVLLSCHSVYLVSVTYVSFILFFLFCFLVTFGDEFTKIRNSYVIFVYILQDGKKWKEHHAMWPKYQKPEDEKMGWTKH